MGVGGGGGGGGVVCNRKIRNIKGQDEKEGKEEDGEDEGKIKDRKKNLH